MALIIAEIGQNHIGDMSLAHQLIYLAKVNGADLVKFQLYDHNLLYKDHPEIPNVELSKEQAFDLFYYGKEVGIEVFFSVFDVERVKWCEQMGVKRYKIAYSQNRNLPLLDAIPKDKQVIVSTDTSDDTPFFGRDNIVELYCVPHYPTLLSELDFSGKTDTWHSMNTFDLFHGFSDHTIGLDAAMIALARGASIIEKHFCINHQTGIDAEWSMTTGELRGLKRWEKVCQTVLSP